MPVTVNKCARYFLSSPTEQEIVGATYRALGALAEAVKKRRNESCGIGFRVTSLPSPKEQGNLQRTPTMPLVP